MRAFTSDVHSSHLFAPPLSLYHNHKTADYVLMSSFGDLPSANIIFAGPYWRAWTVKDIEMGSESNDLGDEALIY